MGVPLSEFFEVFDFRAIQECRNILRVMEVNGISIEQFRTFVAGYKKELHAKGKARAPDKGVKQRLRASLPTCPKCSTYLNLRESTGAYYESEWWCRSCMYVHYTEVSVVDHQMLINARSKGEDPDFSVEELRASSEERKLRRAVCEKCNYLTPQNTCKACGCRMKHRTYYKILTCPKKFW